MPALPDLVLRPLPEPAYAAWLDAALVRYADFLLATDRAADSEEAAATARRTHAGLLAQGLQTPGHRVFEVMASHGPVGSLWLHLSPERRAHVYDLHIAAPHRRQGHARRALLDAMALARAHGAVQFGLNVLASNEPARRLYEQLGLVPQTLQMSRRLDSDAR